MKWVRYGSETLVYLKTFWVSTRGLKFVDAVPDRPQQNKNTGTQHTARFSVWTHDPLDKIYRHTVLVIGSSNLLFFFLEGEKHFEETGSQGANENSFLRARERRSRNFFQKLQHLNFTAAWEGALRFPSYIYMYFWFPSLICNGVPTFGGRIYYFPRPFVSW